SPCERGSVVVVGLERLVRVEVAVGSVDLLLGVFLGVFTPRGGRGFFLVVLAHGVGALPGGVFLLAFEALAVLVHRLRAATAGAAPPTRLSARGPALPLPCRAS